MSSGTIRLVVMIPLHILVAGFRVSKRPAALPSRWNKLEHLRRQIKTKQTVSTNIYQRLTTL
jgi:hypothetical protein